MEKLVYLLWPRAETASDAFRSRLLGETADRLLAGRTRALTIDTAEWNDRFAGTTHLMGDGATLGAAVSLWLDSVDDRGPIEAALREVAGTVHGYVVTESVPQPRTDRDWPDREPSPGVTHFTWFPKPEHLSDEQFFRGWYDNHTPLSFALHPRRWSYVRNTVARTLTPGSPPIRAIVAERFRSIDDVLDPKRYFGPAEVVQRMLSGLSEFADLSQMHVAKLREWVVQS